MEYCKDLYWFEENHVQEQGDEGYIIEQFIGLSDKNGKKIYDGDVLNQSDFPEDDLCPYSVVFEDGAFRRKYPGWDDTLAKPVITRSDLDISHDVVIGNIHENPELLERL
jgi:uncharacterized phage protein (TIGR01671 family)